MPASWISAGVGAIGLVNSMSNSGSSSSGGSSGPTYSPTGLGHADQGWQSAYGSMGDLAKTTDTNARNYYGTSLTEANQINYSPYAQASRQAGQEYGQLANTANQQSGIYGQQAGLAGQQQQNLYGAANQIYNTAFDPNQAQFNQTQQQLQDQVRAGQAARGLGNSAVGASEENQAMTNFDTAWHTQQLANQATGLQAMGQASNAGGAQGQLVGANLTGQLQAGQQGAGYTQQSGQVPMAAQQYIAQQPGVAANSYVQGMQGLAQQYGNQANAAIPYMNSGAGSQQFNANANTAQNAANMNQLTQGLGSSTASEGNPYGTGLVGSYNTPGSWLNNTFNNNSSSNGVSTTGGESTGWF